MGKRHKVNSRILDISWIQIILVMALLAILAAVPASCSSTPSHSPDAVSAPTILMAETNGMDGARLLDSRCSLCHSADRAKRVKKSPDQWEQIVDRMISKGAKLTEGEKTILLDYLNSAYGE